MADEAPRWRPMITAPKDGTRIIVVIRHSEQDPADIDVVRWAQARRSGDPCWTSTDSSHDCAIMYEDWEVAHWMALPSTMPSVRTPDMAARLPAFPHNGEEIGGSGI